MPYRADHEALRLRYATLAKRLAEVQVMTRDLDAFRHEEASLRRALGEIQALLDAGRAKSALDDVRVAAPCSASWAEMTGDDRVRFCGKCAKNVYNLSAMTRDQAEALVQQNEGNLCVRYYQRADGTVLTSDCPVGVQRRKVRRLTVLAIGVGVGASAMAVAGAGAVHTHTLGAMQPRAQALTQEAEDVKLGGMAAPTPPAPTPPEQAHPPATARPSMGRMIKGRR